MKVAEHNTASLKIVVSLIHSYTILTIEAYICP